MLAIHPQIRRTAAIVVPFILIKSRLQLYTHHQTYRREDLDLAGCD